jgi:hypothetical protein
VGGISFPLWHDLRAPKLDVEDVRLFKASMILSNDLRAHAGRCGAVRSTVFLGGRGW